MSVALALLIATSIPQAVNLADAVITNTHPAGFDCGIFKVWSAVDLTHDGKTARLYLPCAMKADLPRVGAVCSIAAHLETIDEIAAGGRQTPFRAYAVDTISCDPPIGR